MTKLSTLFPHTTRDLLYRITAVARVYKRTMNIISGRLADWFREREIRRLSRKVLESYRAGDIATARLFDSARCDAIRDRSEAQIARMERRQGLRI